MLLVKYFVDDKDYSFFFEELKGKNIRLEVKFISISQNISNILSKVLQKYQIKIVRFLDQNYIENYFEDDLSELPEMIYRIKSGQNQNEVDLVPKNKKKRVFEKFFNYLVSIVFTVTIVVLISIFQVKQHIMLTQKLLMYYFI